jgi:hypothetical protein
MGGHIDQRVGARSHSNPNPVKGECLAHSRIRRVRAPMRNVEAFRAQPLCAVIMVKSCLTFLLVCGDSSRPVGVVIIEAPSMPQAQTSAVRGLAAGEAHELSTEMMTSVRPTQIGRIMFAAEAAQMIVRLVQGRVKPEEMTGRFPRPWRVVEHPASFTVQDATGQNVAWFYFRNDPGIAQSIAVLKEEARRRAMNFARLPEAPGAEKGSRA